MSPARPIPPLEWFRDRQAVFEVFLVQLVDCRAHTGQATELGRLLDLVEVGFAPHRPVVTRVPTAMGDLLTLDFFSPAEGPGVVLLAHSDTVDVVGVPRPARRVGGRLYGNGVYDMRGAIALFRLVVDALAEAGRLAEARVRVVVTPDEEAGSPVAGPLLPERCRDVRAVLLPEPPCPDGGVKLRRKGVVRLAASFAGRPAHSGIEPERGRDANRALARWLLEADQRLAAFPGVSLNPGRVEGGTAVNVVSPVARLTGELRAFSNAELEAAVADLARIDPGGEVRVTLAHELSRPALEPGPGALALHARARAIAQELGGDLPAGESGGASDGSQLSAAGLTVLDGLGLRGGGAHTPEEYIELDDYPFRAALLTRLCLEA